MSDHVISVSGSNNLAQSRLLFFLQFFLHKNPPGLGCMSSGFSLWFSVSMGKNLCRFALVSSPKQLTTCVNCPRSLQSSSLGWVGVSDKTATTESSQNSLNPFMHAPRSRVFRFHYHHIPISWTETAQPCQRHLFLSQLSLGYCGCLLASVGTEPTEHSWQFLSPTHPRLQGNLSFRLLAKLKPS